MFQKNTYSPDIVNHSFYGLDYCTQLMGFIILDMKKRITYKKGQLINGISYLHDVEPYIYPDGKSSRKGKFICHCGNEFTTTISAVKNGNTSSCGCIAKNTFKHGLSGSYAYKVWYAQKKRCYNTNQLSYNRYGGRGIVMSDEFKKDFVAWYDYIKSLPNFNKHNYTLDRINNDGNYERGNLRWASSHIQNTNQGIRRDNKTGIKGVEYLENKKNNKWKSSIRVSNERIYLGRFETKLEALQARNNHIITNKLTEYAIQ